MFDQFVTGLKAFYARPYRDDGNALQWAAFLLFTVALTYLWTRVVKELLANV